MSIVRAFTIPAPCSEPARSPITAEPERIFSASRRSRNSNRCGPPKNGRNYNGYTEGNLSMVWFDWELHDQKIVANLAKRPQYTETVNEHKKWLPTNEK
ncbi:MAG: hypothetical protein ACYSWO_29150 [Planctomycetota bacterium]